MVEYDLAAIHFPLSLAARGMIAGFMSFFSLGSADTVALALSLHEKGMAVLNEVLASITPVMAEGIMTIRDYVLAINPGSTSTKVALYRGTERILVDTLRHRVDELKNYAHVTDQLEFRERLIESFMVEHGVDPTSLGAVVGRGGMLKALHSGTYEVNQTMIDDLVAARHGEHASNLGGILAHAIAQPRGIPAYIVDPVSVDEFEDNARLSGLPELPRRSMLHALNIRAVAHRVARDLGCSLTDINLIMVHLGGGISIAPMHQGRLIDVNNANENGPFSPERTGTLPVVALIKLCYSGRYTERELIKQVNGHGGLMAHLGTNDLREVAERIEQGDQLAKTVFSAMGYQIGKEIGAMASTLKGKVDRIVLTGGMAHSAELVKMISDYVRWIAPVLIYPGEDELQALVEGAWRVLSGQEKAKEYR